MAEQTDEEKILENALAPKRASGDSGSVEQHPIADQLLALKTKKAADASTDAMGMRTYKLIPGGSD